MDLRPSPEQEQLVDAFAALYAKQSPPERVRGAEPLGFDRDLWDRLREVGVVAMGVGEQSGGWGASLLDLALVAEQHGRHVAPAPLIEAQVAARLLARIDHPAAREALSAAVDGDRLVTLAVRPARAGVATLVPAGAVAEDIVALDSDRVVLVPPAERRAVDNLGSLPLADVAIDGSAVVLAEGPGAVAAFEAAIDDWMVLTAAALAGIAGRALEIGVDYVKQRYAWGQPIGGFQAISHRLADAATMTDGARLLAYEAAWAAAEDAGRAGSLAGMAFAFASDAARDATYWSLHFHGGYGFMLEYDIQLYYRRARAWARVLGGPDAGYERCADARYGPVGR